MNFTGSSRRRVFGASVLAVIASVLVACAAGSDKPKPADLPPNVALLGVRPVWNKRIGTMELPMSVAVNSTGMIAASPDGLVVAMDAETGGEKWRTSIGETLVAGVGSDGKVSAVVTQTNALVAFADGRELWRQRVLAQVYTAPFVAGGRVFLLAADRSVTAFDSTTGRKLWLHQRPAESLVLRQAGVILAVGDTLVVGLSGRMLGLNPLNGQVRWEVPVATPRGTNDVERLVDLVGPATRNGNVVCARAFQAAVACIDAVRGSLIWRQPAQGATGVHGDGRYVFGTEADGKLIAWSQASGERIWMTESLRFRGLSAPVSAGRSLIVGDSSGFLHLLSIESGNPLNRLSTDGSAIATAPVLVGNTLVAVTRNGGVFGFRPE